MLNTEERVLDIQELLSSVRSKKDAREDKTVNKPKPVSKNSQIGMFVVILLIAALGTMVVVLKAEVTALKAEIVDLRSLKAETASGHMNFKMAAIESRLEDYIKEKEALKNRVEQIKIFSEEQRKNKGR